MAWLAQHLPQVPGSGIIYTVTVKDAERVADWLKTQAIDAQAYHSELESDLRETLEEERLKNEIKGIGSNDSFRHGF